MAAIRFFKYALGGKGFRQATSLLRHCLKQHYDVIFAAGSQVDLQWVIPAYEEAVARGLRCAIAGPNLSTPNGADYTNVPARLFKYLRTRSIVTATSGLKAQHMPRSAKYRIAVPHSLVSLHMVYPAGTFDPYTHIFCCGRHHVDEVEAMNRLSGKTDRCAVLIGYGKAETLLKTRQNCDDPAGGRKHVLIGPSWGKGNILESLGEPLIAQLIESGYRVTLRPHPSFFITGDVQLNALIERWHDHSAFTIETSMEESRALWTADMMIADYSGFAMEFAFMRERPVLYVDVAPKVLNPQWRAIGLDPIEISIRDRIGTIVKPDVKLVVDGLRNLAQQDTEWPGRIREARAAAWTNFGHFGIACANELSKLLAKPA